MWSATLDSYGALLSYHITSIAHNQYTDIYLFEHINMNICSAAAAPSSL